MKVIEISTKDDHKYQKFVASHELGSIHQIKEWGEFQSGISGRDQFWRFAVEDVEDSPGGKGKILTSALVIRQALPLKKCWLYCPRGPLGDYRHPEALQKLFEKIRELGKAQNAVFFRFDPPLLKHEKSAWESPKSLKNLKTTIAHAQYQPEHTLIVDLTQSQDDILKQMKPKGRYNIKVAQKHGVEIRVSHNSPADVESFYRLLQQTTSRDEFSGHDKQYYRDMLTVLGHQQAKLYLAEYREKIVAGLIATFFKDTATYYFGASSDDHRNVMAPYLLQWQVMQDAKHAGFKYYDFLGIAPATDRQNGAHSSHSQIVQQKGSKIVSAFSDHKKHPWSGVTDFKLKFGGKRVDYQPAREIVYQPFWYFLIKLAKKLKLR